jgi:hypothetical protein
VALLAVGTYVRVTERGVAGRPSYVARIVGYDLGRTKYQLGRRYMGWSEWLFGSGGAWSFPDETEEISEADAVPDPAADVEAPYPAGLCRVDGVPIIFRDGVWEHVGDEDDVPPRPTPSWVDVLVAGVDRSTPEGMREHTRRLMNGYHKIEPMPGTVESADVWDCDLARARAYHKLDV